MQVPPGLLQQRLAPTTSAQDRPPVQQFGATPVVVQATASPRVQGAARHSPDWHVSPVQQSPLDAQVPPSPPQQRPDWQRRPPQQPLSAAQAPPALLQQRVAPATSAQERPLAQHIVAEPAVHAAPSVSAQPVGGRQVPDWQVSPAQQSAVAAQVCAELRHTQRPAVQSIDPQHSVLVVHAPAASRQQSDALGDARQESPVQHSVAAAQARPAAAQVVVARMQRPPWHMSPAVQAAPVAQQLCDSAPQAGASQAPATQRAPVGQVLPQRPQLRASPAVSMHEPPQHARPAPLHELPAQQASPRVPQAIAARAQTPLWQVSSASHMSPAQHIWPSPPQATRGRHTPEVHEKPVSQRSPAQQVCASAPQGGTAWQRPASQRKPLVQTSPAQHISPAPPQLTGGRHRPSRHTRPAPQVLPSQQAWLSAPHIGDATQAPPVQTRPCSQASPEQHDCPWVPQSGCVGTSAPPASMPALPPAPPSSTPSSGTPSAQPERRTSSAPRRRNNERRSMGRTPRRRSATVLGGAPARSLPPAPRKRERVTPVHPRRTVYLGAPAAPSPRRGDAAERRKASPMSLRRVGFVGPVVCVVAFVSACGSAPPPVRQTLTAEQLNGVARAGLEDDAFGPRRAANTGGGATPEPEPPPPTASVRVIHASPDRAAARVDVYVGSNGTPGVSALEFRHAAGPLSLPTGAQDVALRAAGAAADAAPLYSHASPALEADHTYTVIALGLAGNAQSPLGIAAAADDSTAPESGSARVRFFHAVAGLGAADICVAPVPARPAAPGRAATPAQPARAVFANAAYGAFTDYAAVPAGAAVTLQVRVRNARPCAGLVRGTVTVTPAQGVATLVATGRVGVGPTNVPRVLLVCPQGGEGATCVEVPVR